MGATDGVRWVLADGTVADPGKLWQTSGGRWEQPAPDACPAGHPLGPKKAIVGQQACLAVGGTHLSWTCLECGGTVMWPPATRRCDHTAFDGRAAR
ncbi:hypothetical protein [Nocardia sp. CC227C]|uniref:hypothetical protein n=1 Tax=Nocardia sp. CC227C TaxID=3044562 RepID=UPI00278C3475|nr:hypothetical protein [Nocardia sp. CC227C]